jgi:hypothetical protein
MGAINKNVKKLVSNNEALQLYIEQHTSFVQGDLIETLNERIYIIVNKLNNIPKCGSCHNHTKFIRFSQGYQPYCSRICANTNSVRLDKIKTTNIAKYGGVAPMCSDAIKTKAKTTSQQRYGAPYHQQTESGRIQRICTNVKKYGSPSPLGNKQIQSKARSTMSEIYGRHYYQSSTIPHSSFTLLNDNEWLYTKHHEEKYPLYGIAEQLNVSPHCVGYYFRKHGIPIKRFNMSLPHREIVEFLEQNNIACCVNDRSIISPHELDIVISSQNTAIEFNGTFWHSDVAGGKNNRYHADKLHKCNDIGYNLINIYEHVWHTKQQIIKSRLLNTLGQTANMVYARKCNIVQIDNKKSAIFFNDTHIQGHTNASICYGLVVDDSIVCAMSFGTPRYNNKYQWELLRFSNKLNTSVVGGASKLLKHFVRECSPTTLISYCDKSWSNGALYKSLNFEFSHTTKPAYWYFHINDTSHVYHRSNFQKHKLQTKLDIFNPTLTEWENMQNAGFDRVWDCGNSVWVKSF